MLSKTNSIFCLYLFLAIALLSPNQAMCEDDIFADFEQELYSDDKAALPSEDNTNSNNKIIPDFTTITPKAPPPSTSKKRAPRPKELDTSIDLLTKLRNKKTVSIYDVENWVTNNPQLNRCYEHGKTILLFMISETANIEGIEYLINQGAELTTHCSPQYDALFYALKHNTAVPVIETLIENNANLMYKDNEGNNALIIAATQNPNPNVLQTLLEYGLKVTEKNNNGFDALTLAAYTTNNLSIIQTLLDNNANIDATDELGHTPLMAAAIAGNDKIMQYLIKRGANYQATDKNGLSVLDYYNKREYIQNLGYTENKYASPSEELKNKFNFISEQHTKLEKKLKSSIYKENAPENLEHALSNQVNADTLDDKGCTTLLNASQNNNDLDVYQKLMLFNANINATCQNGQNALMFLASHQQKETDKQIEKLKYLAEHGIDFNHKDDNGDTPLIHALNKNPAKEYIKTLLQLGADVNLPNSQGIPPLWIAIQNNTKADIISSLLEYGADGNKPNPQGDIPLWYYIKNAPNTEYIKATTLGNTNINYQQQNGDTPLIYVLKKNYPTDIIKVIIEAGADTEIRNNENQNAYDILKENRYFNETLQKKTREHVLSNWD